MNAHPNLATERLRSTARGQSPLRAWRKRQLVDNGAGGRRSMRVTDVPELFGVPWSTWNSWELLPEDPNFRRPDSKNMKRISEITNGEITPADFYAFSNREGQAGGG